MNLKKQELDPLISLQQERYQNGVVSLVAVQELYLYLVRLEAEIDSAREKSEGSYAQLQSRYPLTETHLAHLAEILERLAGVVIGADAVALRLSEKEFNTERESLYFEQSSLEAQYRPEVTLTGSTRFYDVDQGALDRFSAQLGINLTFEIFDSGRRSSRLQGIDARINALESSYRARKKQADQRVVFLLSEVKDAQTQLEALEIRQMELDKRLEQQRIKKELSSSSFDEGIELLTNKYDLLLAQAEIEQSIRMAKIEYLNESQTLLEHAEFPRFRKD